MVYLTHYQNMIRKARMRTLDEQVQKEEHHIVPMAIYDARETDALKQEMSVRSKYSKSNTVDLTLREHYLGHCLLVKASQQEKWSTNVKVKLLHAFNLMSTRNPKRNSSLYESLKGSYSKVLSAQRKGRPSPAKGCKWSDEAKRNLAQNHKMRGKTYEQIYGKEKADALKQKRREGRIKYFSDPENRKKLGQKLKGRTITPEWREKLSIKARTRKRR